MQKEKKRDKKKKEKEMGQKKKDERGYDMTTGNPHPHRSSES
jgi:hypothetical protein